MTTHPVRLILMSVSCTALAYFAVGLPLAVLPGWVTGTLGYSAPVAGLVISAQYIATIASRVVVGPLVDRSGARGAILGGFACCIMGGLVTMLAHWLAATPIFALAALLLGRIMVGLSESLVSTSAIAWGISRTAPDQTGRIISWNGIATYGAIAAGAPVGVWLFPWGGMSAVGVALVLTGVIGLAFVWPQATTPAVPAARLPFRAVFARVAPYGLALALGAIGFGVTTAFVALHFAARHWSHAWMALSGFGMAFILARILFTGSLARYGGPRVAVAFLLLETTGLFLIWLAPGPVMAIMGTALAGFGFSLIFPALGLIVVELVPVQNRGAAIGTYALFLDVALCVAGPAAGLAADRAGYAAPFLLGSGASFLGLLLVLLLMRRQTA